MIVNSVRNYGVIPFRAGEADATKTETVQQTVTETTENTSKALTEDKFENKTAAQPQAQLQGAPAGFQLPSVQQIAKMEKTQKLVGGTLVGVGALGLLSTLSKKTWVRFLFTAPAGLAIAGMGASILYAANSMGKVRAALANQANQQ